VLNCRVAGSRMASAGEGRAVQVAPAQGGQMGPYAVHPSKRVRKPLAFVLCGLILTMAVLTAALPGSSSGAAAPSWFYQATGNTSLTDIAFADASHGWAVGISRAWSGETGIVLATTDGGNRWFDQYHYSSNISEVAFTDASHGWALAPNGSQGTVLGTTDGGGSWSPIGTWRGVWAKDLVFADATHGWLVGEDGNILATSDGGVTWAPQVSGTPYDLTSVTFVGPTHGWITGYKSSRPFEGFILATTDGGVTWTSQTSAISAFLYDIAFTDTSHGWAVGTDYDTDVGILLSTTDSGASWVTRGYGGQASLSGVAFSDASHGWVVGYGSGGAAFATTDGGVTWGTQATGVTGRMSHVTFVDAVHGWALSSGMVVATNTGGFLPPAPTISSFSPSSGHASDMVIITGTRFTDATEVAFHGTPARGFTVQSSSQISVGVPDGATSGPITVTTPGGTATSSDRFTVIGWGPSVVTPTVTLKLSGLTSGVMRLGKSVTAKGKVTPTSLAGSKVKLSVQKKRGARWVTLKSVKRTISTTGAYSWKYKPVRRGAYRMRATIGKTVAHTAAKTKWRAFRVK